ncbi:MAG TPA: hypothetical protein VEY92_11945 [Pseudoxanthomonas sp.]|nr:hypothetical protein [Pseudoxanthomonas sp.]
MARKQLHSVRVRNSRASGKAMRSRIATPSRILQRQQNGEAKRPPLQPLEPLEPDYGEDANENKKGTATTAAKSQISATSSSM